MRHDLDVVVVTHDSVDVLDGLIASLPAAMGHLSRRLIMVDSGSTDATLSLVGRSMPDATTIALSGNLGYAAGVNAGIAAGSAPAVLVLNPDVRLAPGCGPALLDALEQPSTGITVPRLAGADGRLQRSLRREPTMLRALGEAVLGRQAGRVPALGEVVMDVAAYEVPTTADWATGCAMMISRSCLDAVGRFHEGFFLYSEEVDFMLRARDRRYRVRLAPTARAVHIGGEAPSNPDLWALMAVNRVRCYGRRHGRLAARAFWAAVMLGETARALRGAARSRAAVAALFGRTDVPGPRNALDPA